MIVKHKRKVVARNVKCCETILSRALGLMLTTKGNALLVAKRESVHGSSIHMFFMLRSLDIAWLDKDMKVVDIAKNVKPFTAYLAPKRKAKYVLELEVGSLNVKEGDKLGILR
tara:strand:- start:1231 stop:1569 length:339 start_codon:yes stop_codon:yes gene_type:complete